MKKTGWIIVAVIVVLVLWMFSGYMMPQLAKIVKAYAKHERETFEQVTKARAAVGQVKLDANNLTEANLKQFTAAQGELTNAFSKLMLVAESSRQARISSRSRYRRKALRTVSARPVASTMRPCSHTT